MVETIKFSEFASGGDLEPNQTTVGLDNTQTINTRFTNPFPLLPPGTTGDRPPITPSMYYRLRFNTTTLAYEYYEPLSATWIEMEDSASVLPLLASHLPGEGASLIGLQNQGSVLNKTVQDLANASILAQTDNGTLVNGVFLSALSTGFMSVTTATGALVSRTLTGTANQIGVTNGTGAAGNPVVSIADNPLIGGTASIGIPHGTTAERPVSPAAGYLRYNTTTGFLEYWNALTSTWVSSTQFSGPSTNNALARFDGTGGVIKNSNVILDDTGNMTVIDGFKLLMPTGQTVAEFTQSTAGVPTAWLRFTNSIATSPSISAFGTSADIDVQINPKGAGGVRIGGGNAGTTGGLLKLYELAANGTNFIGLKSPDDITTAYTLTYPAAPPAVNNMFLTSTTGGALSWANYVMNASWTPVPFGTTGAGTPTGTFLGRVSRVGDVVMVTAQLVFTAITGMTGEFQVSGLPYTIRTSPVNRPAITVGYRFRWTNNYVIGGFGVAGGTTITFYNMEIDNTVTQIADLSATTNLYFELIYNTSDA